MFRCWLGGFTVVSVEDGWQNSTSDYQGTSYIYIECAGIGAPHSTRGHTAVDLTDQQHGPELKEMDYETQTNGAHTHNENDTRSSNNHNKRHHHNNNIKYHVSPRSHSGKIGGSNKSHYHHHHHANNGNHSRFHNMPNNTVHHNSHHHQPHKTEKMRHAATVAGTLYNLSEDDPLNESTNGFNTSQSKSGRSDKTTKQPTQHVINHGLSLDNWFASRFAKSSLSAFSLFCEEYEQIRAEPRLHRMPQFLRPNRVNGPRTVQSKELACKAHVVDGFKNTRYIACEGPNRSSVYDFWELIWQERVSAIVMLNVPYEERNLPEVYNPASETIQYWPTKPGTEMRFVPYQIKCVSSQLKSHYLDTKKWAEDDESCVYRVTKLKLIERNPIFGVKPRDVIHICHMRWPDGTIPRTYHDDVTDYIDGAKVLTEIMREEVPPHRGPVAVHCHAGVGRTGVAIAIETCIARAIDHKTIDVYNMVRKLREQRPRSVMNCWQYACINLAVAEYMKTFNHIPPYFECAGEKYRSEQLLDDAWAEMIRDFEDTFVEDDMQDLSLPDEEEYEMALAAAASGQFISKVADLTRIDPSDRSHPTHSPADSVGVESRKMTRSNEVHRSPTISGPYLDSSNNNNNDTSRDESSTKCANKTISNAEWY